MTCRITPLGSLALGDSGGILEKMAFIHLARDRDKVAKISAPGNSPYCSKSENLFCGDQKEPVKTINTEQQTRLSSVLEQGSRMVLRSRWENNLSRLQTGRSTAVQQRSHSPLVEIRGGARGRQSEEIWSHNTDRVLSRDPGLPFSLETSTKNKCLLSHRPSSPKDKEGKERGTRKASKSNSVGIAHQPQEQQQQKQQLLPLPPGVWYLTSTPPDLAAPNLNFDYGPVVPLMPFSYPGWFCFPTAYLPTCSGLASSPVQESSNRKYKEEKGQSSLLVSRHHQHLMINSNDLDDLYGSLCQAIQTAKSIRIMTKNISQSLISDLSRVRTLKYLSTLPIRKL
ncbi:uncharacterized protein LOC141492873 isoform X2 [Macrotis lagotis]